MAQSGQVTPEQKVLIKQSFALVEPIAETAAALFYDRLFQLDPTLRGLFHGDMREQGQKLMQMIAIAVRGLDNLAQLVPAVEALGRRHARYGIKPQDFSAVGEALLWTLERGLGHAFTSEVRDAWAAVYTVLAETMLEGMRQSPARAAA
jgi:hemoglobin-like flavoprotein